MNASRWLKHHKVYKLELVNPCSCPLKLTKEYHKEYHRDSAHHNPLIINPYFNIYLCHFRMGEFTFCTDLIENLKMK